MINNYYQYKKDETKIIKVPEGTTVSGKTNKFDFLKRWEFYERAGEIVALIAIIIILKAFALACKDISVYIGNNIGNLNGRVVDLRESIMNKDDCSTGFVTLRFFANFFNEFHHIFMPAVRNIVAHLTEQHQQAREEEIENRFIGAEEESV